MESFEKPNDLVDQIFELENQIDMRRSYISQHESHETEDTKTKMECFRSEIKELTIKLIKLRLEYQKRK